MSGTAGSSICEAFVEALGLKTLFMTFMGKVCLIYLTVLSLSDYFQSKRPKKSNIETPASEDLSHILGVISSLLSNLPSESPSRIRLLAKFVEEYYEKVDKLIELRDAARKRLNLTEAEVEVERQVFHNFIYSEHDLTPIKAILASEGNEGLTPDAEDAFYIRRLDGGLFTLQTIDYILGWLIMEDDGVSLSFSFITIFFQMPLNFLHVQIRTHALRMLDRKNQSLQDILQTLRLTFDHVDDEGVTVDNSMSHRDILQGLISALGATHE